jgi:hypothetical protein
MYKRPSHPINRTLVVPGTLSPPASRPIHIPTSNAVKETRLAFTPSPTLPETDPGSTYNAGYREERQLPPESQAELRCFLVNSLLGQGVGAVPTRSTGKMF